MQYNFKFQTLRCSARLASTAHHTAAYPSLCCYCCHHHCFPHSDGLELHDADHTKDIKLPNINNIAYTSYHSQPYVYNHSFAWDNDYSFLFISSLLKLATCHTHTYVPWRNIQETKAAIWLRIFSLITFEQWVLRGHQADHDPNLKILQHKSLSINTSFAPTSIFCVVEHM